MFNSWFQSLQDFNIVTIILLCILIGSLFQGWRRGASSSAGRLFSMLRGVVLTLLGLAISVPFTIWLSSKVQLWLTDYGTKIPSGDLNGWEQVYYTFMTFMANFPLMRFAVLFIVSYLCIRLLFGILISILFSGRMSFFSRNKGRPANLLSRVAGLGIGAIMGLARSIVVVAILFIYVSLYPTSTFSQHVEASPIYQDGAQMIIEPLSGNLVKEKLPVFTKAVEHELGGILQQKYDIIDRSVPADVEQAAEKIAGQTKNEEEKARLLYEWVGTRVTYDYSKVDDYEQKGIWHEQTPKDTFDTKLGVCIDYARLYAVMARSQGLKVKVVTGLGYNGQGGYGPHAWNEVFITDKNQWIPLDPTWAKSGNWFNPPKFAESHVEEKVL